MRIRKLAPHMIARMAAGEVIQGPVQVIKELVENALDAGATSIVVNIGMADKSSIIQSVNNTSSIVTRSITVKDDGCGIDYDDLPLLCARHATSKLSSMEDLLSGSVSSLGFRGEALASISQCSRVTVTTKSNSRRNEATYGYRASYLDGILSDTPTPIACNVGTTIYVNDLFYNMPLRKSAFLSSVGKGASNNVHSQCLRLIQCMSIHWLLKCSFQFSSQKGSTTAALDIATKRGAAIEEVVRDFWGRDIAAALVPIDFKNVEVASSNAVHLSGVVTSAQYHGRQCDFILFINDRLVESSRVKRTVDNVYRSILPKNVHPWCYLHLQMPANWLDVNVHPTKREVCFVNEDEIMSFVSKCIYDVIRVSAQTRVYTVPTLSHQPSEVTSIKFSQSIGPRDLPLPLFVDNPIPVAPVASPIPYQYVRNDPGEQKLDVFLKPMSMPWKYISLIEKRSPVDVELTSIRHLKESIHSEGSHELTMIIKEHTFVGIVDSQHILLQNGAKLYFVDISALSQNFFYQVILHNFANFGVIELNESLDMIKIVSLLPDVDEFSAQRIVRKFVKNAEMLNEYFSIVIDERGHLLQLPLLISDYMPNIGRLPWFLRHCATEIDWQHEEPCLRGLSQAIATLYSISIDDIDDDEFIDTFEEQMAEGTSVIELNDEQPTASSQILPQSVPLSVSCTAAVGMDRWRLEYLLLPNLKRSNYFQVPSKFDKEGYIQSLADLRALYKIFERC